MRKGVNAIMTNEQKVELLKEKAGISCEEAKEALEQANWDLLDAVLLLEKADKARMEGGAYSTQSEKEEDVAQPKQKHAGGRDAVRWLGQAIRKLVRIGNANQFIITRNDKELLALPVTAFAILLICLFWAAAVILIVGLFCGLRYSFRGPNLGKQTINDAMNRAADVAESVKEDLMGETSDKE